MANRLHRALGVLVLSGLATAVAVADGSPDRRLVRGRELALNVCSACHLVASDQPFSPLLRPPAPSFVEIAARPGLRAQDLRRFVVTTHWDEKTLPATMPNPLLTEAETADVVRYIMSLTRP